MIVALSRLAPAGAAPDRGWEGLTTDGHIARIRPLTPDDAGSLHALAGRVSDRSLYLRFFSVNREVADNYLCGLARPNDVDHVAVVAEIAGTVVAVAGWERSGVDAAEVAVLVEDDHHQRGIGTLLLEDLAARARANHITRLVADTLIENHRMLDVFGSSGLTGARVHKFDIVHSTLATSLDDSGLAVVDEREARAEVVSLEPLFAPRSVAVIGAEPQPGGVGHEVLCSILAGGFTGSVHVVNPGAPEVAGLPSIARVTDIQDHVDLAIIAVRADQLLETIEECGTAGVRAALVLTADLGEAGESGAELERRALDTARIHDMRLVGPDCLGLVNTDPEVRLDAWLGATTVAPGPLAIGTQSGAVGIAMADLATRGGLGVASLVSLGHKVDVSGNDLLLRWWHDPRVKVIALYLGSLGNPRKFARLARRVGAHTPVLVVKGGRFAGGHGAARSVDAAPAADATLSALFAQAGVVRLDTVGELVDVARLLAAQPVPAGGRLAVVGDGGGIGVLAADAAQASGVEVPVLSGALREAIRGRDNPVDLGAGATPTELRSVLEQVAASGEADAVLVSVTATSANHPATMLAALGSADLGDMTVLVNVVGGAVEPDVALLRGDRAPVYEFPESAVRALGHAVHYGRWRRTPTGAVTAPADVQRDRARALVDAALAAHPEGAWLDPQVVRDLFSCYGIDSAPIAPTSSRGKAIKTADRMGHPVLVKTGKTAEVHGSDVGGVILDVSDADADAVARASDDESRLDWGVMVQPHVDARVQLSLSVAREGTFGPVVTVGLGGVHTDLLADRAVGLLPLTDRQAASMLRSLRVGPLLGYRGAGPIDIGLVEGLMLGISALATDLPEVAELDVVPVMLSPRAAVVVDARLRLSPPPATPDEARRGLRR